MAHLIDKDALVAEIEKQKQLIFPKNTGEMKVADVPKPLEQGWLNALSWMKKTIDTLEVKEIEEEPISEDLEQAIDTYLATYFGGEKEKQDWPFLKKMAIHFANWQKKQFEKNRLAACDRLTEEEAEIESDFVMSIIENEHRQPTFDDAIKYGMRLQKENMMLKAINTEASLTMSVPSICISLPLGVNVGDKVKVIVIKED